MGPTVAGWTVRLVGLAVVFMLAGCAGMETAATSDRAIPEAPVPMSVPMSVPVRALDDPHPDPHAGLPPLPVVLNDPHNAQLEILQIFSARLGRPYQVFNLANRDPASVRERLRRLAPSQVVVIGPAAYETARNLNGIDIVFSGIVDPDSDSRGVDALPSVAAQLDYWQSVNPGLRSLGVIGGSAMSTRISRLAAACEDRGLILTQRLVSSDKEALLAFRSMVPHIDGFVFLPDEQVLSPGVIQQVMSHGRQNEVQILAYSPLMFNLGATLLLQPDPVQVATFLIRLLEPAVEDDRPTQLYTTAGLKGKSRIRPVITVSASNPGIVVTGDG